VTGAAQLRPGALSQLDRAEHALRVIEREAERLCHGREDAATRRRRLDVIDRQTKVLALAVEVAYRSSGPQR